MNEGLFIQTPDDIKKSYCDLLAHQTLVENHTPILTGQEMIIDSNRKIAQITFNPPIELSGDIKIDIRQVNITSDHSSFIWFNTSFITDKLTIFSEAEIDRSKSSSSSSSLSSSAYSYSDSTAYSVATTMEPSEISEGSVLPDIESTPSHSMSAMSSSRSLLPLVEDSTDREFFIRCEFTDKWLDDSEEYQALQIEREMNRNRSDVPLENEDGKNAISIIQKAGTQIITSTRNLISRVSSQTSGLHRSGSGTSSPNLSRQSSYSSDVEMKHMTSPPEEAGEARVSINEVQLRDRREIELRKKMKLNSVHESEEFRKSLNVVPQTQENHTKVDEESSDEIQLDSEASA